VTLQILRLKNLINASLMNFGSNQSENVSNNVMQCRFALAKHYRLFSTLKDIRKSLLKSLFVQSEQEQ